MGISLYVLQYSLLWQPEKVQNGKISYGQSEDKKEEALPLLLCQNALMSSPSALEESRISRIFSW